MSRLVDLTGQRFGRLVVVGNPTRDNNRTYWKCICDCGKTKLAQAALLKRGKTKSCGCLGAEQAAKGQLRHGHAKRGKQSRTYRAWRHMMERCNNPNFPWYAHYGGRGISVCSRWSVFENFLQDMGDCLPGKSLDRVDNDGDYCAGNCRWATRKEQARNTRTNVLLTLRGRTMCLAAWSEELGIPYGTLRTRRAAGWSAEKILEKR